MIFSRWNPTSATYDYFEVEGVLAAVNDDLPVPKKPPPVPNLGAKIGLPSTEGGRELPSGARFVGSGEYAIGHLTPPKHVRLGATDGSSPWFDGLSFLFGAAAVTAVWYVWGRK